MRNDFPSFKKNENRSLENLETHRQDVKAISTALLNATPVVDNQLLSRFPLAVLQALDQHLYEHYDTFGSAPPPLIEIENVSFMIHRRVLSRSACANHTTKSGHIQAWLEHHWVLPCQIKGIEIQKKVAPAFLHAALARRLQQGEVSIFVGHFPDGVKPDWLDLDQPGWQASKLTNKERRWHSVVECLAAASAERADIVVFPELTICPELRERVANWLDDNPNAPFSLVLPGSFHTQQDGSVYNTAELFDRFGNTVLSHRKLTTFGPKKKHESIATGNKIELLDTSIGLIAMPICLDFCEEDSPFNELWQNLGVEWLLVPAFGNGKSISAHLRKADNILRTHGTVTALANQNPEALDKDLGFVWHGTDKALNKAATTRRCFAISIAEPKTI